jgi:hypothetical protein
MADAGPKAENAGTKGIKNSGKFPYHESFLEALPVNHPARGNAAMNDAGHSLPFTPASLWPAVIDVIVGEMMNRNPLVKKKKEKSPMVWKAFCVNVLKNEYWHSDAWDMLPPKEATVRALVSRLVLWREVMYEDGNPPEGPTGMSEDEAKGVEWIESLDHAIMYKNEVDVMKGDAKERFLEGDEGSEHDDGSANRDAAFKTFRQLRNRRKRGHEDDDGSDNDPQNAGGNRVGGKRKKTAAEQALKNGGAGAGVGVGTPPNHNCSHNKRFSGSAVELMMTSRAALADAKALSEPVRVEALKLKAEAQKSSADAQNK